MLASCPLSFVAGLPTCRRGWLRHALAPSAVLYAIADIAKLPSTVAAGVAGMSSVVLIACPV